MKIFYLGNGGSHTTSFHRAAALQRLGHSVVVKDPRELFASTKLSFLVEKFHYHTGYKWLQTAVLQWLKKLNETLCNTDIIWINGGEFFGPECLQYLKTFKCPIILYNNDDPPGGRDGRRFKSLLKAIPFYDLCVVVREPNVSEFYNLGAKRVMRSLMSYDEFAHLGASTFNRQCINTEVAFLGTWMRHEGRDKFLLRLHELGVPISIWGDRWQKSPLWLQLRPYYKGGALKGKDYVDVIRNSKITLGLLSKGNRDLHTTRSFEIPFAGGLLCAERTIEHLEFYKEGVEAVFWSSPEECAEVCTKLLNDDKHRENIRVAGMKKVRELKVGNEDVCRTIINEILYYFK